ncbi:MAG: serine hydrolase [Armatimonadota bacterium]
MRRIGVCIAIVVLGVVLAAGTAGTQSPGPRAVLERLFTADRIRAEWFASSFLAAFPASGVEQIVADLKRTHGPFQRVEEDAGAYLVVLERAVVPTRITLDAEGRIVGLLFQTPRARVTNVEQAVQALRALPGRVGLVVLADGQEQAALNPDVPLAVGSAFKLAVLAALREQIASGQRSWREVVELRPEWKSLPSGILQNWPDGSFLSVQTLASLMISQSDNTATDTLIHLVGRGAVEAAAPPRNRPFLTTREAFLPAGSGPAAVASVTRWRRMTL